MAPTPAVARLLAPQKVAVVALVAVAGFWVAYDDGSYGLSARSSLSILVWWAIGLAAVAGVTRARFPRTAIIPAAALAALAAWGLASVAWAPSAEAAFGEFNRDVLYLGLFVVATTAGRGVARERVVDGVTVAVTAVALLAITSRLLPGVVHGHSFGTYLPATANRVSYPLGYWNGLAIFVALAVPLLLRLVSVERGRVVRGAAVAALPVVACVIYLASSRGGVITAVIATIVFCVVTGERANAGLAIVVGGSATIVSVVALVDRKQLVNGPLGTSTARNQGLTATLVVFGACLAAGVLFALGSRVLDRRRLPVRIARLGAALVFLVVAAVVTLAHPLRRFEDFKRVPQGFKANNYASAHLLSGSGSGRWQFWTSAADEWRAHPLLGGGAGSFQEWWARHAPFSYFIRDAHSLYLQTLGELGIVGLALLASFVLAALAQGGALLHRHPSAVQTTDAAVVAVVAGFLVAAGIDWMWELTAVGALGVGFLGLLVAGPARTAAARTRRPGAFHSAVAVLSLVLIVAQAIPWLAQTEIGASQAAVARGDISEAARDGLRARAIQPWAASPYLQLALTSELSGRLVDAERWIRSAIARDGDDWELWLVAARVETKLGRASMAHRSLDRAVALNPQSPLFAPFRGEGG